MSLDNPFRDCTGCETPVDTNDTDHATCDLAGRWWHPGCYDVAAEADALRREQDNRDDPPAPFMYAALAERSMLRGKR